MSQLNKSTFWIDAVNRDLKKHKSDRFLTSKCEEYPDALRVMRLFHRTYPVVLCTEKRRWPRRSYWIRDEFVDNFLSYFRSHFDYTAFMTSVPPNMIPSELYQVTPLSKKRKNLRDTDLALNEAFFKKHLPQWHELSQREVQEFEERKDVHHENIYGRISRFDDMNQDFISGDKKLLRQFVGLLNDEIDNILASRIFEDTRYMREIMLP